MKKNYFKNVGLFILCLIGLNVSYGQITTFDFTGGLQTYIVPAGVYEVRLQSWGAEGMIGGGDVGGAGGLGGYAEGVTAVTPGETLTIYVGGSAGYNGGAAGGNIGAGNGGGASDIRQGGVALADRIIVAGGGGGGGATGCASPWGGGAGGGGGGLAGVNGVDSPNGGGGFGGTLGAGGAAGIGCGGYLGAPGLASGIGGDGQGCCCATTPGGGGGGGGYVVGGGGGGGSAGTTGCSGNDKGGGGGGAGGSSFVGALTETVVDNGVRVGNGQVIIEVVCLALTVTVSSDVICLGESFTLDASGVGTISWDGGVENGLPFTPVTAGIYTYTATSDDAGDCGYSLDIEVLDLPEVIATADVTEICDGEALTLNGSGADSYVWDMGVMDGVTFTPAAGTHVYTVTGTDALTGCENSDDIEVLVHELPTIEALATDNEICLGESITLYGAGGETYVWTPAGTIDDEEFTPDATGSTTYEVTGTDGNGCVNTASTEVTVYDAITITYTTVDEMMGADGAINITVTGGNPAYSFDWDNDGTGDFDDTEDLADLVGGTYIVVVEDEAGCSVTEIIIVNSQLGIEINAENGMMVYPNPSTKLVTIQNTGAFTYEIVSLNGEVVLKGDAVDQKTLNIEELAAGSYLIEIANEKTKTTIKFIKQ